MVEPELERLLTDLVAADPALRGAALAALEARARGPGAPYDAILTALAGRRAPGPGREPDPELAEAIFRATMRIASRRARIHGLRVERPADLAGMPDRALWRNVLRHTLEAADIYSGRAVLRVVLDLASPGQCALFAVYWTDSEVCNGGLDQYFANPTAVLLPEAADGYRAIGAPDVADLLLDAVARFPAGFPLGDQGARQDFLDELGERLFGDLDRAYYAATADQRLARACADYVRGRPDEFFLPAGG